MPPRPPNEQNPKHLPPCILAPVGHQRHQGPFFDLSRSRRSFPAVSTGRDTEIDQDHRAINATQAPNDAERLAAWTPLSGVPPSRPYDSGPRRRGEFLSHAKGMKDKYPSTNRRVTAPPSPAKGEDLILAPCTGHQQARSFVGALSLRSLAEPLRFSSVVRRFGTAKDCISLSSHHLLFSSTNFGSLSPSLRLPPPPPLLLAMSSTDTYPDVPQANQGMAIALVGEPRSSHLHPRAQLIPFRHGGTAPLFAGWIVNIFMCGSKIGPSSTSGDKRRALTLSLLPPPKCMLTRSQRTTGYRG